MPLWLRKQLRRAYAEKNGYQVKILNQCWFYYRLKESSNLKKGKVQERRR
ncbi:cortex morphogenetic protein CmpA [Bacillus solitudinis]|nr:cortex morphogenetic protein CmpA [Bacillus solitudinis]